MQIKRFTMLDFIVICILLGCTILFIPFMRSHAPDTVVVYKDNVSIACYPLMDDCSFTIQGAIGPIKICIKNKAVWVDSATCPERICVLTRPISKTSQQIICEPNHIVIEISPTKDTIDGVSR
jgi:hypothetical protein